MVIGAAAILAILTRGPEASVLVAAIESAPPPLLVSPLSVYQAIMGLAFARGGFPPGDPAILGRAADAVTAFLDATGAKEIILTADLRRRALDEAADGAGDAELAFARACAKGYRTHLLVP